MAIIIIEEAEKIACAVSPKPNRVMDRYKRQSLDDSERSATDAPWRIVFFIVFTFWIFFLITASVQQQPRAITVSAENSTKSHNSSELVAPRVAPYFLWGRHWTFDAITFNSAFLQAHYDESGVIVVAAHLLFSIGLLIYAIGATRTDDLFHGQLDEAAAWFALIFIYTYGLYTSWCMRVVGEVNWPIPEAMFFVLWYTKRQYVDAKKKKDLEEQLLFHYFEKVLFLHTPWAYLLALYPSMYTWSALRESDWSSALPYTIIAACIYVALTIHYFLMICTACGIDQSIGGYSRGAVLHPSLFGRVWRYHLGTACYHATLIFPRLKTLAVMNEAEFKEMLSDEKLVDRLALTQGKLHDLSLMATAVASTDYSESMRELLRHSQTSDCCYVADSPNLKYFQGYAQIFRSALALILSTNNLMTLLLWSHGAHDSVMVLATWKYYLALILLFGIAMRTYDTVRDTILLHSNGMFIEDMTQYPIWRLFYTAEN